MNSQPEKSNLHIPINWTLRAFGISLSLEEGVKWLRKKYPANTLEMKKLSQQAKSHICTEIWTRLAGKSIVQCTMYNSSKLCMHLLCSAFMLRNLQWTLEPTIWLLRRLWRVISEKKFPGDWLQEKTILARKYQQKNSNTENKNLS